MKKLLFTPLILLFVALPLYSQQQIALKFRNLNTEQGLSNSNVICMMQDRMGFIWIGTENGLNLYNGYEFVHYKKEAENPNSLSDNRILSLVEDSTGDIWVGTYNGLNKLDRKQDQFVQYFYEEGNSASLASSMVSALLLDSKGTLWVGTAYGLSRYADSTNTFENFLMPGYDKIPEVNAIQSIAEDKSGNIWIGARGGLLKMVGENSFINYTEQGKTSSSHIVDIFFDDRDQLWASHFDSGISKINLGTGEASFYRYDKNDPASLSANYVYQVIKSQNGQLWAASDDGLNRINPDGTFLSFQNDLTDESSLSSSIVTCLLFDKQERMWVGTRLGGVCVYDEKMNKFQLFQSNPFDERSLSSNKVGGFAEDAEGNLIVATDGGGINFFDKKNHSFRKLQATSGRQNTLTSNKTLALQSDKNGDLWVGTWAGGLNRYNPKTGSIKHYRNDPADPRSISGDHIFDLFEDGEGNLWVGTWGSGLSRYDSKTDDFTNYQPDPNDPTSITSTAINDIEQDRSGNLWIATEMGGLDYFDPVSETFIHYRADGKSGSLPTDALFALLMDSRGRLWVGTNGEGLCLLDAETNTFTVLRTRDGLPSDAVVGLQEDDEGYIWISTHGGISRLDAASGVFKNYSKADGLQDNEFMPRSSLKLSSGELVFGGNSGFNVFDPSSLQENTELPSIYITDFKLFNEDVKVDPKGALKQHITFTDELVLNYDQNFFSVEYTGINYTYTDKNRYRYILEGLQSDWIEAGGERKVSYTGIAPGNYTLKVQVANNDGVWNPEPAVLHITIVPPFWATWWFRTLCILIIASGIFAFVRYRMKVTKENRALLERKVKEATEQVNLQNEELIAQSNSLQQAIEETNFVVKEAVESGNFSARIDTAAKTGEWKALGDSINQLFESVVKPFNTINRIVNKMAEGDLTERFTEDAKGDILNLATNLNAAMDRLCVLLGDITRRSEEISSASGEMMVTSEEMNVSTGEIANAIAEMSKGAQDQVAKVDESSNFIEGILRFSNEMGDQAVSINGTAKLGVERSNSGMKLMGDLDGTMKYILEFSQKTNQSISALTKRSKEITGALNIIKEIASQTNLLALNAAIEAAQAGDAGRGFSVVAEEIRKLAEGSKQSVAEIEALVSGVQTETGATAHLIEEMNATIKTGGEATGHSLSAFEEITRYYQETLQKSEQILAATRQQTKDIGDVVKIIDSVVVIAEETAAGTEQTASSSSELSAGMTNYTAKSKQVLEIAEDLSGKVSKFRLKNVDVVSTKTE